MKPLQNFVKSNKVKTLNTSQKNAMKGGRMKRNGCPIGFEPDPMQTAGGGRKKNR